MAIERVILHSDLNSFYASVECLHRPEIRYQPVAVGGDAEQRHGIILAKNDFAKPYQIKTGDAIWQARQKCPNLIIVPPNFPLYMRFSRLARAIYMEYTDQVEPFGIDESWLDVTGSVSLYGSGWEIADKIRRRMKQELGLTVSVGVSDNKIFAKLGSDYKKPDTVTVIDHSNLREVAWPLPVSDLLYVGPATKRKLADRGIRTIGQLAQTDISLLRRWFGKIGEVLWTFSNGLDRTPVNLFDELAAVKSIGNSTTTARDLQNNEDVKLILFVLAESVASRMRDHGFKGRTVCISVRDNLLISFSRQHKLTKSTCLASEITAAAFDLFRQHYHWHAPIRSIGVSMTDFSHGDEPVQFDLFSDQEKRDELETLECAVDGLRQRFGNFCVRRAALLKDEALTGFNPKQDHTIHPIGYFQGGSST